MNTIESQLRDYARYADETLPWVNPMDVTTTDRVRTVPPARPPLREGPKPWIAVAAAAAVLIVVGGIALLSSRSSGVAPTDGTVGDTTVPNVSTTLPPNTTLPSNAESPENGWVAFSTQPGLWQARRTVESRQGGDIYLVRAGSEPIMIVSRGDGKSTNVCPLFSPDGSKLAYGHSEMTGRALVILEVAADGSVTEVGRFAVPGVGPAPCPTSWSPDGLSVASIQRQRLSDGLDNDSTVIVQGLDGSTQELADGDPTADELVAAYDDSLAEPPLVSPDGRWLARYVEPRGGITISRPDGSDLRHVVYSGARPYSVAAWSPDSRFILTMRDVGGGFTMVAYSIEEPFEAIVLVDYAMVNDERSWPGRGDVSWQRVDVGTETAAAPEEP